jgi:hypothetical protein
MMFRPASSSQVLFITSLVILILLGLSVLFFSLQFQARNQAPIRALFLVLACVMLFLAVGSLAFRIRSYEISGGELVIHTGFGKKVVPLQGLQDVSVVHNPFAGARKNAAISGVWSFYGVFTSPQLGDFHAYATVTSQGVLLSWPDKKILVTPVDAAAFIQSVKTVK